MKKREEAKAELAILAAEQRQLEEALAAARREHDLRGRQLQRLLEDQVKADFDHEDDHRIVAYSGKACTTLLRFREAVVGRHLQRIQEFILEGYRQLLRKKSLIASVKINPANFGVELFNADDDRVLPDRLSAGERQLLAVSILWGLARASGYSLPVVIDTPLGRLDASHRTNLVERYFPRASHQVLLLSTDKEIDEEYYELLKPKIGRSYRLEFSDKDRATRVVPGYFW